MLPLNEVHKNMRHKLETLGTRFSEWGKKKIERVENVVNKKILIINSLKSYLKYWNNKHGILF